MLRRASDLVDRSLPFLPRIQSAPKSSFQCSNYGTRTPQYKSPRGAGASFATSGSPVPPSSRSTLRAFHTHSSHSRRTDSDSNAEVLSHLLNPDSNSSISSLFSPCFHTSSDSLPSPPIKVLGKRQYIESFDDDEPFLEARDAKRACSPCIQQPTPTAVTSRTGSGSWTAPVTDPISIYYPHAGSLMLQLKAPFAESGRGAIGEDTASHRSDRAIAAASRVGHVHSASLPDSRHPKRSQRKRKNLFNSLVPMNTTPSLIDRSIVSGTSRATVNASNHALPLRRPHLRPPSWRLRPLSKSRNISHIQYLRKLCKLHTSMPPFFQSPTAVPGIFRLPHLPRLPPLPLGTAQAQAAVCSNSIAFINETGIATVYRVAPDVYTYSEKHIRTRPMPMSPTSSSE